MMATKICTKCGTELELNSDNFYKQSSNKDGYQNYCKVCRKAMDKARVNTQEYRDEHNKRLREKYATDEQYREKVKQQVKLRKQTDKYKEQQKRYRQTDEYKIKQNIKNHNRRAVVSTGQGLRSIETEQEILKEWFNNVCVYSGVKLTKDTLNWDHIIPLSKGGINELWNLVPCYDKYNFSKNNREPLTWYQAQEYYSTDRLEYIIYYQKVMYWNFANKETVPLVLITGETLTYEDIVKEYGELE